MIIVLKGANFSGTGNNIGTIDIEDPTAGPFTVKITPNVAITLVYKINGGSSETVQVSTSGYTISDIASGSSLSITASADGYNTYTQTYTISFNRSISITLSAEGTEDPGTGDSSGDIGSGLDSIAYENLTYRDIFITNNLAPDINNNSMSNPSKSVTYDDSTGTTTIIADNSNVDNFIPGYKLYVTGETTQQARSTSKWSNTTDVYIASYVNIENYTQGYCGLAFGSNVDAAISGVTNGWKLSSAIVNNEETSSTGTAALFIGSCIAANLTGYINNPVAILMSIFNTPPSVETLNQLYITFSGFLKNN